MIKNINIIISVFCLISMIAVAIVGLVYLSMDDEADAGGENMFVEVADDDIFTEYKHVETGCHYIRMNSSQTDSFTQMFEPVDGGGTKPYCD